jgi:hypothetical protein
MNISSYELRIVPSGNLQNYTSVNIRFEGPGENVANTEFKNASLQSSKIHFIFFKIFAIEKVDLKPDLGFKLYSRFD